MAELLLFLALQTQLQVPVTVGAIAGCVTDTAGGSRPGATLVARTATGAFLEQLRVLPKGTTK